MNFMKSLASVMMLALLMSCENKNKDGAPRNEDGSGNGDPKTHATAVDAANAGKADMLAAMDRGISFGVDKEKLRAATPGEPIQKQTVNFNALLRADTANSFKSMMADDATTIVPLVNGREVVAVIGLQSDQQQYRVAMLGERQLSTELDQMAQAGATQGQRITLFEVPNIMALVYEVSTPERGTVYFTSYNGNSLTQPLSAERLIPLLRNDAQAFQKQYGDKLKGNNLVR